MRTHTLLTLLAVTLACFSLPAAADSGASPLLAAARQHASATQACLAKAQGDRVAQLSCCSGHKGVCGCRAGKIICCDNTASNEPGCSCHGDEPLPE